MAPTKVRWPGDMTDTEARAIVTTQSEDGLLQNPSRAHHRLRGAGRAMGAKQGHDA